MQQRSHQNDSPSLWKKSSVANLYRYTPSGTYFMHAKVGGKLIRRSLKTTVYSVAKLRIQDQLKQLRQIEEIEYKSRNEGTIFSNFRETYEHQLEANPSLKPNAKLYRRKCIKVINKTWPELNNLDIRKISEKQCLTWAKKLAELYSPSVYNNTVGTLRQILQLATKAGVRFANPAMEIRRKPVRAKQLQLPSQDQFKAFIQSIIDGNGRFSRDCSRLVQFLAYGGFRIGEAGQITWEDIDLERGEITVKGDPITGTKNSEIRIVPIIPPMRNLLLEIKSERNDEPTSQKVMRVFECQKAMNRAAKITGMSRITHHDLRHLFATRCIESGVDIPTVARWLGHKDGGALAMKVYGHLRDEHSQQMAEIVQF